MRNKRRGVIVARAPSATPPPADIWDMLDGFRSIIQEQQAVIDGLSVKIDDQQAISAQFSNSITRLTADVEATSEKLADFCTTDDIDTVRSDVELVRSTLDHSIESFQATEKTLSQGLDRLTKTRPCEFIIDKSGDLIVSLGDGSIKHIGRVVGDQGEPGASIETIDTQDGKYRIVMSDGRQFDAGPVPVLQMPVPDKLDAVSTSAIVIDSYTKNTYEEIGIKHGVSARTVAKIVADSRECSNVSRESDV